ncbi:MAG: hypothetical protein LC800_07210 [Acidobacteria bacterium]|nr:hypothetical protein [Acidobacteriota bacterium]
MDKDRDDWGGQGEQQPDAGEWERRYGSVRETIVPQKRESESYVDIIGIQMFAYCEEHNKHFPAGESCPMPH